MTVDVSINLPVGGYISKGAEIESKVVALI